MENDLRGIWKTRDDSIVNVEIRGLSAQHNGNRVYMGCINKGDCKFTRPIYWNMDGLSLDYQGLDLISRGADAYGKLEFS